MALFALADTHLSTITNKPMDIFGERWKNHAERLSYFWKNTVKEQDTVVLPGDISWGMSLEEAMPDLHFLSELPGHKIIGKGNHDYWWATKHKIETAFEKEKIDNIDILYNNAYSVGEYAICGSRGWYSENTNPMGADYEKIVSREVGRIRRSLDEGIRLQKKELLCFLHFPPITNSFISKEIIELLQEYHVKRCYYGHLHGQYTIPPVIHYEGIDFTIIAADYLQFCPLLIE